MIDPMELYGQAAVGVRRRRKVDVVALVLGVFVAAFLLFILVPILSVVVVSFSSASFISFPMPGLSLRWYYRIVEYWPFMDALQTSIELALASAALGACLGVPAALALVRRRDKASETLAALLLAPISIPAIVLGFSLLYYLAALSFGVSFLALLITHTVVAIPYVSRTVASVYVNVPKQAEEAASVLGATRWQTLRLVTLPLVRSGIVAGVMFAVLISFDNLSLSFFFGTAATNTLPVVMLAYMENQFDPSIAAISTVQMALALVVLLVLDRYYGIDRLAN